MIGTGLKGGLCGNPTRTAAILTAARNPLGTKNRTVQQSYRRRLACPVGTPLSLLG